MMMKQYCVAAETAFNRWYQSRISLSDEMLVFRSNSECCLFIHLFSYLLLVCTWLT